MPLKEIEKLKEKVEKDPNSKLFVPLAEEYKKEGMLDEAIDVLLAGIDRQPGYMSARVSLGKIYLEKGMNDEAKDQFESVIRSIPDNLYAHKKLAEIYRNSGDRELAAKAYRTILKLNSLDEDAMTSLRELDEGKPPEEAPRPAAGEHPSSEEELHEAHVDDTPYGEISLEGVQLADVDAGLADREADQQDELDEFRSSLFGGEDKEEDISEEITAEDLPEEGTAGDDDYLAVEKTGVELDIDDSIMDEDIGEEEIELADEEAVPEESLTMDAVSFAGSSPTENTVASAIDTSDAYSGSLEEADRKVSEGDYGGALRIYGKVLSDNPGDRKALQRLDELRGLLKMLGKDKEELLARLGGFLEGVQKRHDEFLGRT